MIRSCGSSSGDSVDSLSLPPEKSSNTNSAFRCIEVQHGSKIAEVEELPMEQGNGRQVSATAAGDAVIVRGAEKSYKTGTPVLNGLNMTVPCGSM